MPNTLRIKRGLAAGLPSGTVAEPLFTTDTYDLYIGKGDGTNQKFQKYIASGTSAQILAADGSIITAGTNITISGGTISATTASGVVTGSGTTNFIPKWTSASALGNSIIQDSGTKLTVNSTASEILAIKSSSTNGTYFSIDNYTNTSPSLIGSAKAINGGSLGFADLMLLSASTLFVQGSTGQPVVLNAFGGNVLVNTTTDDTINKLQVAGGAKLTNAHLGAGTATVSPISFTTGVLKTTPATGDMEVNGGHLFYTASARRGIISPVQWIANTATRTFVSNTNSQNMFDTGSAGANTFTVVANTTYFFEVQIHLTGLSATANSVGFGLSAIGAVVSNINYTAIAEKVTAIATPTAPTMCKISTNATTAVTVSSTATAASIRISGLVRITTGGSLTPVISQIGGTAASVLGIGSYVKFYAVGSNTDTKNPVNGWA